MVTPTVPARYDPVRHDPTAFADARAAVDETLAALEAARAARHAAVAAATTGWTGLTATRFRERLDPHLDALHADAVQQLRTTRRLLDQALDHIEDVDRWRARRRDEWVERWYRERRSS